MVGSTSVHNRGFGSAKGNQFPQVMLLSLQAGGVGLNLVGANHLFMLDMHWNPQMESQACDRIYRSAAMHPDTQYWDPLLKFRIWTPVYNSLKETYLT